MGRYTPHDNTSPTCVPAAAAAAVFPAPYTRWRCEDRQRVIGEERKGGRWRFEGTGEGKVRDKGEIRE